jgi:hypothetical protein
MKIEVPSAELCSAATLGALLGLLSHAASQRSLRLGRDAYLARYAATFDRHMAHPPSAFGMIVVSILMALLVFAVFKGVASVYGALLSAINSKTTPAQE